MAWGKDEAIDLSSKGIPKTVNVKTYSRVTSIKLDKPQSLILEWSVFGSRDAWLSGKRPIGKVRIAVTPEGEEGQPEVVDPETGEVIEGEIPDFPSFSDLMRSALPQGDVSVSRVGELFNAMVRTIYMISASRPEWSDATEV